MVLDSRPLSPLFNDQNDLLLPTPKYFLIGKPLSALPQDDVNEIPSNQLSYYKGLQQLIHFWSGWLHQYLTHCINPPNGRHNNPGSMAPLRDDTTQFLH